MCKVQIAKFNDGLLKRLRAFGRLTLNFAICTLLIQPAFADECSRYKSVPSLQIKEPSVSVAVFPSEVDIGLLHGKVVANLSEEYEIDFAARPATRSHPSDGEGPDAGGGWCVFPEKITATIGFSDFSVFIDRRYKEESCEWLAIAAHEDEHIAAHLTAVRENRADIEKSLAAAAAQILPVFVESESGIPAAMDGIEKQLSTGPQMRLIRQKLAAEQAVADKKIDLSDRGARIAECTGVPPASFPSAVQKITK
ncbi:MAG: hypothetical protein LBL46_02505 [Rickettsiales bacterium]|jgi:hypothetical protein|nr:hypothetical protein [Rickettsiales bacterium]